MKTLRARLGLLHTVAGLLVVLWLGGCGPYPASISSKWDIRFTASDHYALTIGKLSVEDYPRLAKFTRVSQINFKHEANDAKLKALAALPLPELKYVLCGKSAAVTDEGVLTLLGSSHFGIRGLQLAGTRISDRSLFALASHRSVTAVNVVGCPDVTSAGLQALMSNSRVRSISFSMDSLSRDEAIALLKSTSRLEYCMIWDPARKLDQGMVLEIASHQGIQRMDLRQGADSAIP